MGQKELLATLKELKELKVILQELDEQIEALKDTVKAEMIARGTDKLLVGSFSVHYTTYSTSRFDTKAFKESHGELFNQFSKKIEAHRFTLS